MKIIAFIEMFNEVESGNLIRCLENVKQWADDIVIYDDMSTDQSVEIARKYTKHIIHGIEKNIFRQLYHRQQLLELAISLNPDWIMWIDLDEILDRKGTKGELRKLCEELDQKGLTAASFHELNLWRGENWCRLDTAFNNGWFCRLWKNIPGLRIETHDGIHQRLYPINIEDSKIFRSDIRIIHYGFFNYEKMLYKIGVVGKAYKTFPEYSKFLLEHYDTNWILDERNVNVYEVPNEVFPEENIPKKKTSKPVPFAYLTEDDVRKYAKNYNE